MNAPPPPTLSVPGERRPQAQDLAWQDAAWLRAFGPELAPRFGAWGQVQLAPLPSVPPAWAGRLRASHLLLVPGGPWPGLPEDAGAWTEAWAKAWHEATGGQASALRPMRGPLAFQAPPERRAWLLAAALEALKARPPEAPLALVGHSYGAVLVRDLAEDLIRAGHPVQLVAQLEVQAPHTGWFAREAPAGVPRLLLGENQPNCVPSLKPGQALVYLLAPGWPHMDWVLRPPAQLWRALYAGLAAPSWALEAGLGHGPAHPEGLAAGMGLGPARGEGQAVAR